MFTPLTIFRKGILIVSIPLLTQAIFLGVLIKSASDNAAAQRWAVHTKQVIAKVEESNRRFLEANAGVRDLVLLAHPPAADRLARESALVPITLTELRDLVADNRAQQSRVDDLTDHARGFSSLLARMERLVKTGDRSQAALHLDEAALSIADLQTRVDAIRAEEVRLDDDRMAQIGRATTWHYAVLTGGGAATTALTLMLAVLFLNWVVRRLDVLRENTRKFAEGSTLSQPLTGGDELAQVDQSFRAMAASLEEKKQENEMFVYSVSHDLRSPLINLQGFSQELRHSARDLEGLFENTGVPPDVREKGGKLIKQNIAESVHYIQAAVERLARIIDALLRLSRAGRVHYHWQELDIADLVGKIIDALHDNIREKKVEIVVNPLPKAYGDPMAVEQVFANLLGNAIKYLGAARPGRIEVGSLENAPAGNNGFRVYYVKDNGVGIPEAYHSRVFTAFNRLHADTSSGEGIGLALVRRMVERLGGSIWLESAPGVGTTFFTTLPSHLPEAARAEETRSAMEARH